MTIEQKVNGRSFKHPFKEVWAPVEIPQGETPVIELGKGKRVVLSRIGGSELLRLDVKREKGPYWETQEVVGSEEINRRISPWAGQIRWRRG